MNELIQIEKINPLQLFTQEGVDPLLGAIRKEVSTFSADVSTANGRKEIASMAHKIARSKTLLDGLGKDLVTEWKAKAKVVDESRKKLRDELDALKETVRGPLTEWEAEQQREEERVQKLLTYMQELAEKTDGLDSSAIGENINALLNLDPEDFGERYLEAKDLKERCLQILSLKLDKARTAELEKAELERLRKYEEEREKAKYEEQLKAEAAEHARRQVEAERLMAIKQKEAAELRAKEAEERAARDAELAALREREKIAAEKRAEEEATAKREANKRHQAKVHSEVLADLATTSLTANFDLSREGAKALIAAIAKGQIRHVSIKY